MIFFKEIFIFLLGFMANFYDLKAKLANGDTFNFSSLKKFPCLIMNIACGCPLHSKNVKMLNEISSENISILLFPCDQFFSLEPHSNELHPDFILPIERYMIFQKVNIIGNKKHEVFEFLAKNYKKEIKNNIKWNYTKFLIDHKGKFMKVYEGWENIPIGDIYEASNKDL